MPIASDVAAAARPGWSVLLHVDEEYARLRHIGNMEFARLFELARRDFNAFLVSQMRGVEHFSEQMIVHISIDFRSELAWSPEIDVHVRVSRVGRTSYELECTIWDGRAVAVHSRAVNVWVNADGPAPINEEARALLASCS